MLRAFGDPTRRRQRIEDDNDEDANLPAYIARPNQRRRGESPPHSLPKAQQQQHVVAEAPVQHQQQQPKRGFRFSPPRKAATAADLLPKVARHHLPQQQQPKPIEARGFGREPPAFEPPPPPPKSDPAVAVAAAVTGPKKPLLHWKDVHGLKMEAILKLDKEVRRCRFKPAAALLERIEYTLHKFMTEQYLSTRGLARELYKGGVKSIWIVSPEGHLGFMQESAYVRADTDGGVEAAFERLNLPTDDGSIGVENAPALEPEDEELSRSVRQMFRLPAPHQMQQKE